MIIQTGQRTDIPAYYSEWFAKRLKEGFVYTRNPFDPQRVTKYVLDPSVVDAIGFCTKNPKPMFRYMNLLEPYGQYWFVTITPYGKDIEPNVPPKEEVMESLIRLSGYVGIDSVGWRYDPILITETYSVERHLRDFEMMAGTLAGHTKTCVISFIDIYEKTKRNFPEARVVSREDRILLGTEMIKIAGKYGMTIRPCSEGDFLGRFGADTGGCITKTTWETAIHARLNIPKSQAASVRDTCACTFGRDIGQYNTCGHLCRYCYANADAAAVKENMMQHDPASPLLVGNLLPTDIIHEADQKRWRDDQISIFDLM